MNVTPKIDTMDHESLQQTNKLLFHGFCLIIPILIIQLWSILWEPEIWHAWLSVGIYLSFCVLSYRKAPILFWLFFLFYFAQGTAIASCAYLESGNYISEQTTFAYATGATSRLVLYDLMFFLSLLYLCSIYNKLYPITISTSPVLSTRLVMTICLGLTLLLGVLFVGLYSFGIPLLERIDRYDYWLNHPMPILRTLSGQIYVFVFLLGLMYSCSKRRIILLLLLVVAVYAILQSVKFSGLFLVGYFFLSPIIIISLVYGTAGFPVKKILLYGTVVISILISVIWYHYSTIHLSSEVSVVESIINRVLGLQGHVWWGTDTEVLARASTINFDQLSNEASAFTSPRSNSEDVGMRHLMSLVAPPRIARAYLEKGVNFTMGYPAIGLQLFGYLGLALLQVISASIVGASTIYLYRKIVSCQLIRGAIAIKLFIEVYGVFTIGNLYPLASTKVMLYLFLVFLLEGAMYLGRRREIA